MDKEEYPCLFRRKTLLDRIFYTIPKDLTPSRCFYNPVFLEILHQFAVKLVFA